MKKIILFLIIFQSNYFFAQSKNYTLEKNGEKFQKIIRYVMLHTEEKINVDTKKIIFNINKQRFMHNNTKHKVDTCSNFALKNIKVVTTSKLIEDEYREHLDKTKKEGIKMPLPLNHYNSRVFIIEKIIDKKIVIYEVDWLYSIY